MIASRQRAVAGSSALNPPQARPVFAERAFYLLGALVVLLAVLTHYWRLDLAEFKQDELDVATLALALAQQGQWPAHGILSSIGTYNGPLFVALEALPALLWPTPLAMTVLVAALDVATVGGTLLFAGRYFGATAALVAGLTFATAPWAVLYGRKIWEQDALPPFVLLFFVGLFLVVVDRRPWWLLLSGAAASVAIQLHPSAIVLPLVAPAALALRPRRFAPAPVAAALGLGLLLLLPYLAQEWSFRFADWATALHQPTTAHLGHALALFVAILNWAQAASAWQVLGLFTADGLSHGDPWYVVVADLLAWLGLLAAAVLLIVKTRRGLRCAEGERGRRDDALLLLTLWLLLPALALGATGMLTYAHYFIVCYPAPFLAYGILASRASRLRVGAGVISALLVLLIVCNLLTLGRVAALAERATAPSQYGLPLAYAEQAATAIVGDAHGTPVALSTDAGYRDGDVVIARLMRWDRVAAGARTRSAAPPREYWVQPASAPPPPDAHLLRAIGPAHQPAVAVWAANDDQLGGTP